MWTDETRLRHDRSGLRYTHELTDEEWSEIEPLIPPSKPGGNKRTVNVREIVNGLIGHHFGSGAPIAVGTSRSASRPAVAGHHGRRNYLSARLWQCLGSVRLADGAP